VTAPVGALVRIFYDGANILVGEALRTTTGRVYVVVSRRVQKRGAHVGRQHLGCVVATEPPEGAKCLPIHWYRRRTKK
jgi:hypothetical protein